MCVCVCVCENLEREWKEGKKKKEGRKEGRIDDARRCQIFGHATRYDRLRLCAEIENLRGSFVQMER